LVAVVVVVAQMALLLEDQVVVEHTLQALPLVALEHLGKGTMAVLALTLQLDLERAAVVVLVQLVVIQAAMIQAHLVQAVLEQHLQLLVHQ
jgi:hypothetical protein